MAGGEEDNHGRALKQEIGDIKGCQSPSVSSNNFRLEEPKPSLRAVGFQAQIEAVDLEMLSSVHPAINRARSCKKRGLGERFEGLEKEGEKSEKNRECS